MERAGGRSRSATVAPRYLFAQEERRVERSDFVVLGAPGG